MTTIIKKLPNICLYSAQFSKISPSAFFRIRNGCCFHFIVDKLFKANNLDRSLLLPNLVRTAHIGTVIHKLFEERVKGLIQTEDDYESRWEQYIKNEEDKIKINYPTISGISFSDYDKMYESMETAFRINAYSQSRTSTTADSVKLEFPVGYKDLIYGTIDRLNISQNEIEIIDYKSGEVFDESGNIKNSIVLQLNLYAICCEFSFNKPVSKLTVIRTKDLTEIDIPIIREQYQELVDEISIFLNKLNSTTEFESFQIPSEESCAFCSCKHLCKKYLESDIRSPRIVDGYVTDISNRNYIKLCDNRGQYFTVNKIADINIPDYDKLLGKHLLFTDVNSYVEGVFCRTSKTIIFELNS